MEHECSVIALAGTPKAGKTTIFNGLTGMCRYTGSWWGDRGTPGRGTYTYCGQTYMLLDMPGAYSLPPAPFPDSGSRENRDSFLGSQQPDVIAVVADATRLELGLHLLKQVLGMDTGTRDADNIPVILCVNFCDEALRTGLVIDYNLLEDVLQIPVIPCCARRRSHLDDIKAAIHYAAKPGNRKAFCYDCLDFSPKKLAAECICASSDTDGARRVLLDLLLTGPVTGKIILLFLLAGVLHLTMIAAGFPSRLLWEALSRLELSLDRAMTYLGAAPWLTGCLVHGGFRALSWTAAIMLPPLAVFLFFFTLLEDLGFLPRASMGMDPVFGKCGACGGQCVTMALGLGCNAAGVACCRSIQSPKERTIAVLTNSMIPCCGRFPVFIMLIPLFFCSRASGLPDRFPVLRPVVFHPAAGHCLPVHGDILASVKDTAKGTALRLHPGAASLQENAHHPLSPALPSEQDHGIYRTRGQGSGSCRNHRLVPGQPVLHRAIRRPCLLSQACG